MRRQHRWLALAAVTGWLLSAALAGGSDWPRFRGPNGTGIAKGENLPVQWKGQEAIAWKVKLPGSGHSSPVVSKGRIFLESASSDGKERWLLCLDAGSGKLLWQQAAPGEVARTHPRNSLASSTPAADGERVYAVFWDGKDLSMCAYDYKGTLQWKTDLGGFVSQHGAGLSPVVDGGRVFLNNDQDGTAHLVALDARSGKVLWKVDRRAFRTCYSTPFLLERGSSKELVVSSTAGITSYDPENGKVNWHYAWQFTGMALRTVASPVAIDGLVVATSGDGSGARDAIAVRVPAKAGDRPELVWEDRRAFPYVPCLLPYKGHLYGVTDKGVAACHVAATGEEVWSERLVGGKGNGFTASPVLVDDKVYAVAEDGTVFVFAAATQFKLLGRSSLGESVSASPAVADGRLFIRGRQHLFCIGKPSQGQ
jgi:outer membrane protein assembly factor BamB